MAASRHPLLKAKWTMHLLAGLFLVPVLGMLLQTNVSALALPDGHSKICIGPSGQQVPEQITPLGGFWGVTNIGPGGPILIRYDINAAMQASDKVVLSSFNDQPPAGEILKRRAFLLAFTAFHECAHARLGLRNEYAANCEAVRQMEAQGLMSSLDLAYLQSVTVGLGPLPAPYGGSGAAFWAGTMQCVNASAGQPLPAGLDQGFQ